MAHQGQSVHSSRPSERRLTAEYVAARALLDATTIDEAAPKILEAICEALGWEHGALWTIDREADALRCAEIWTSPLVRFPEFDEASRRDDVQARHRPAWAGLGQRRARVDPRRRARRELPPRGHRRSRGPPRRVWFSSPAARRGAQRHGVLQPRDPRTRCRPALHALDGRQPDRHVHRSTPRSGRARSLLHPFSRHAVRRRVRRQPQARQPRVAPHSRLRRSRPVVAAVSRLHPSRRSRGDDRRSGQADRREGCPLLRESLLAQRRDAALAALGSGADPPSSR